MDPKDLQNQIHGRIIVSSDVAYPQVRRDVVWPENTPERYPRMIVQATNQNDVVKAVKFARAAGLKVAVRGGGHNWVGFALRDDSLLIDLGQLNKVSIDNKARIARIQPAITGRELNRLLVADGLAFPIGHCGVVPLSGYLLSGGIGWNVNAWGPACFSIKAANVVTADGNLVVASEHENSDLLWAVRGGGPGFFGVVTEYTIHLFVALRAITTSIQYYPLELIEEVGDWAGAVARALPKEVELTIRIAAAPSSIADRCKSSGGFAFVVSATAFMDTPEDAAATLRFLDGCPSASRSLLVEREIPTPIGVLDEMGAAGRPKGRYLADTLWTNSSPREVLSTLRDNFTQASSKCDAYFAFSTGSDHSPFPDAAYSMKGNALVLCYALWERPEDDAANMAWHRATIAALEPYAIGHYVGESDIVSNPRRAERSYAKANWRRLQALRQRYDPYGLFSAQFT